MQTAATLLLACVARAYLSGHCPGEDRTDLWMADWIVVHPRRH